MGSFTIKKHSTLLFTLFYVVILVCIVVVFLSYHFPFPISSSISTFIMDDANGQNLFQFRNNHIKSKCEEYQNELEAKYKEFSPKQTYENIVREAVVLYNSKSPFLWCRIPKVASQSWSDLFVRIW